MRTTEVTKFVVLEHAREVADVQITAGVQWHDEPKKFRSEEGIAVQFLTSCGGRIRICPMSPDGGNAKLW